MSKPTIYCSGPLFCPEELAGMLRISRTLENAGYETFLPQRDGIERFVLGLVDHPASLLGGITDAVHQAIFCLDVFQIAGRCGALVCNLNGRVSDEGAIVEASVAWALGKPVVLYKEDVRSMLGGRDNSMVIGLAPRDRQVHSPDELPGALQKALDQAPAPAAVFPPALRSAVERGRRIWELLRRLPRAAPPREVEDLLRQFETIATS